MRIKSLVFAAAMFFNLAAPANAFVFDENTKVFEPTAPTWSQVWAKAKTESWQVTGNTVWNHCGQVIDSYGQVLTVDVVVSCEAQVALANNRSKDSLGRLDIGEEIYLPLTRYQVAAFRGEILQQPPEVANVAEKIAALRVKYEALTSELKTAITSEATTNLAQADWLKRLTTRVETLERQVVENQSAIQANRDSLSVLSGEVHGMGQQVATLKSTTRNNRRLVDSLGNLTAEHYSRLDALEQLPDQVEGMQERQQRDRETVISLEERVGELANRFVALRDEAKRPVVIGQSLWDQLDEISWWSWLLVVLVALVLIALMGWLIYGNRKGKESVNSLQGRVKGVEERVGRIEEEQMYWLEENMQGQYSAADLTENKLNSLKENEAIELVMPHSGNGAAKCHVKVFRRQSEKGSYLELVGVRPGVNRVDPRRRNSQDYFELSQLYRKLKKAERNGEVIGLMEARERRAA